MNDSVPQAVLLELEGVVVRTHALRGEALRSALAAEGVTLSAAAFDDVCHGMPLRAAVRASFASEEAPADETAIDLAVVRAEEAFVALLGSGATLVEGAAEGLAALHARGRLGVVTRATRREAALMLSLAELDWLFELVITSDDVPLSPKPSPGPYTRALARLARRRPIEPRRVMALEDGRDGIRSARAAGLRCLAVGEVPVFRALDADGYLPTLRGVTLESLDVVGGRGDRVT